MAANPLNEDDDEKRKRRNAYGDAVANSIPQKAIKYIASATPRQFGADSRDAVSRGIEHGIGVVKAGTALADAMNPYTQAGNVLKEFLSGYFGADGEKAETQTIPAESATPAAAKEQQPTSTAADTKNTNPVNQPGANAENVAVNSPQNATSGIQRIGNTYTDGSKPEGGYGGSSYTNPETEGMNDAQKKAYWQNQSAMYDERAKQRELEAEARFANMDTGPSEYEKETAIRNARLTAQSINRGIGRQRYRGNEADMTAKLAALELGGVGEVDRRAAGQELARSQARQAQLEQQLGAFLPKVQTADEKAFGALALQKAGQDAAKGQLELNQAAQVNTLQQQYLNGTPEEKKAAEQALIGLGVKKMEKPAVQIANTETPNDFGGTTKNAYVITGVDADGKPIVTQVGAPQGPSQADAHAQAKKALATGKISKDEVNKRLVAAGYQPLP